MTAMLLRRCGLVLALMLVVNADLPAGRVQQTHVLQPVDVTDRWICGTGAAVSSRQIAQDSQVSRAEVIPTVVPWNYRGPLKVVFELMGDHQSITISSILLAAPRAVERTNSGAIDGRIYSTFELTEQVDFNTNRPGGSGRDDQAAIRFTATLNGAGLGGIARLYVSAGYVPRTVANRKISDTIQYTAHVVNVVSRDELRSLGQSLRSKWFYQHFADSYDSIVLLPTYGDYADANFTGIFFSRPRSLIGGIGQGVGLPGTQQPGNTDEYGSTTLQGLISMRTASPAVLLHEIAHQWGDFWNWPQIANIAKLDPSHPPLWGLFESPLSYRLSSDQFLSTSGDSWAVTIDPEPTFSPLDLYAMGRLAAQDVPPISLLENQDQQPRTSGKASGASKRVTIDDIVRVHGPRTGPVVDQWRSAIVVVSIDHLLSEEELAYFDYFARRASNPNRQENIDYTFEQMTGAALDTRIYPRDDSPLPSSSYPRPVATGGEASLFFILDSEVPLAISRSERLEIRGGFDVTRARPPVVSLEFQDSAGRTVFSSPSTSVNGSGAFLLPVDVSSITPGRYRVIVRAGATGAGYGQIYPVAVH